MPEDEDLVVGEDDFVVDDDEEEEVIVKKKKRRKFVEESRPRRSNRSNAKKSYAELEDYGLGEEDKSEEVEEEEEEDYYSEEKTAKKVKREKRSGRKTSSSKKDSSSFSLPANPNANVPNRHPKSPENTIEKILCRRVKGEKDLEAPTSDTQEFEYLVKWKDLSYLHVTWLTAKEILAKKSGKQRIASFEKKQLMLQNLEEPFDPTFTEVDRIIGEEEFEEDSKTVTKFLVKWESLPYASSTWERQGDINVCSFPFHLLPFLLLYTFFAL